MPQPEVPLRAIITGTQTYLMPQEVFDCAVADFPHNSEGWRTVESLAVGRAIFEKRLVKLVEHQSLVEVGVLEKQYRIPEYMLLLSRGIFVLGPGNGPGRANSPEELAVALAMASCPRLPPPYSIPRDENWEELRDRISVTLTVDGKNYMVPELNYIEAQKNFRPGGGSARTTEDLAVCFAMHSGAVPEDELWQDRLRYVFTC
ncbi:hypothetical protein A3A64_02300 [Candidatus Gottesmanbacteria bacterium RIFCSPLOWO2_01_FULL_48_11]|uniref:Uncharacterized protein n=2 Tax=Candidatus Gottesmaniibacteriota TaxID=1752720 RepID=A0A0G1TYZ1_9BACT|nr:MAG: hypothetical protein UY16_C0042G0007 [Candidatus Gottesmanbacteria bacterium GW2011_GWA2_47_9]OGG27610.1 MAG: hypothetical protein A3A64_02300 [Candidatus Gottesmanbacteria bacterium RIFCSPLOWO2_01_FULL_48_11]